MLTRRDFLKKARVGASVAVGLPFLDRLTAYGDSDVFRIVFAEPAGEMYARQAASARRGVELGMEEASRVGDLLGRRVEWDVHSEGSALAEALVNGPPAALIGGFDREACLEHNRAAREASCIFVNVGCVDDDLRAADCSPAMIHVQASRSMFSDAVHFFRASDQESADRRQLEAVLWDPSLFRYGAAQLNERFTDRFGDRMDGPAWAGWMAVKVMWEASTRAASRKSDDLRAYLVDPSSRFDGHKGWPLSFRTTGAQLRQPLYLVDDSEHVVAAVPEHEGADERSAGEILDILGSGSTLSVSSSPC